MARGDGAAGMAAGMLVALFLATTALAGQPRYNLSVDGLACPFCAYGIEKELQAVEGVASVETQVEAGTVIVTMKAGERLDRVTAKEAVEDAGFTLGAFARADAAE